METRNIKKDNFWKKFFLEQLFLLIIGIVSFIVFIIISFIIEDKVYLYLAIGVLGLVLLWICGEAILCYIKNRKQEEEEPCLEN